MRQYTTPDQTAKLIELGFDRPKFEIETQLCNIKGQPLRVATIVGDYSIGELIEMLPKHTDDSDILHIEAYDYIGWDVWYGCYCNGDEVSVKYSAESKELIDALYDMVITLNKKGII